MKSFAISVWTFWTSMLHEKKKIVRINQIPFMAKNLSKEIMKRSRLRYRFLKAKVYKIECYIHNNWIIVYFFQEIRYYANLNQKTDFYMITASVMKGLTENRKYVKTEMKTAEIFNSFYSNIVKNLKICQYSNFDPI